MASPTKKQIIEKVTEEVAERSNDRFSAAELEIFHGVVLGPNVPPKTAGAGLGKKNLDSLLSDLNDWITNPNRGGKAIAGPLKADMTVKALEQAVGARFTPKVKI